MQIRECTIEGIAPFVAAAKRERLLCNNTGRLFAVTDDAGNVLAFAGLRALRGAVKFTTDYTRPEYRGRGLWRLLFDHRLALAKADPSVKLIKATCTALSIDAYVRRGAVVTKTYRNHKAVEIRIRP